MTTQKTRIESTIKEILFPTNANGLVSCLLKVEVTPELEALECGGVGFGIGTHIDEDHNRLPFQVGDKVVMHFDEKGDLVHHQIIVLKKGFTKLPRQCVACDSVLRQIKNKEVVEGLLCTNMMSCTAQSNSPIYRLSVLATEAGAFKESIESFIHEYPEAQLTHLSDLKIFLKSDPNTAPREALWNNPLAWNIEKAIWNYLNQDKMEVRDFWIIGFNKTSFIDPRMVLQHSTSEALPKFMTENIDRIAQLINFFDHWKRKEYVTKDV